MGATDKNPARVRWPTTTTTPTKGEYSIISSLTLHLSHWLSNSNRLALDQLQLRRPSTRSVHNSLFMLLCLSPFTQRTNLPVHRQTSGLERATVMSRCEAKPKPTKPANTTPPSKAPRRVAMSLEQLVGRRILRCDDWRSSGFLSMSSPVISRSRPIHSIRPIINDSKLIA